MAAAPPPPTPNMSEFMASDMPVFQHSKHISYWLRCLRTPLPHQYTSSDSNRISLAYFTLSALDLLGVLFERTTDAERREYVDWIYLCQHPHGGFRSSPAMNFGGNPHSDSANWDPASVPSTFFALCSLAILQDDFAGVRRADCLRWLSTMQRPDGSFGEMLGPDNRIEGGMDTRFSHCASGIRWILHGADHLPETVPDIDVDGLVSCIDSFATSDGGISQGAFNEAHAGLTYCGIGALYFTDRVPGQQQLVPGSNGEANKQGARKRQNFLTDGTTVKWLLSRLTTDIEEDESDDEDAVAEVDLPTNPQDTSESAHNSFEKLSSRPARDATDSEASASLVEPHLLAPIDIFSVHWVGMNGRSNKLADTCYVFWVGASLTILNAIHLTPMILIRNYLLERTQHLVMGGFGKLPGALPDIYHAYLGLAVLCMLNATAAGASNSPTPGLKALDPALCISVDAKAWIQSLSWKSRTSA